MRTKHQLIMDSRTDRLSQLILEEDDRPWYIPAETRMVLIYESDFTCAICHRTMAASNLHIDHRTPVSLGGKATYHNLQVLCQWCNLSKSNHVLDPSSYKKGYVIPIIPISERRLADEILRRVESEEY